MIRWIAGVLVLVAASVVAAYTLRPAPAVAAADFTDDLKGPASPHLTIPFEAYALTPDGLLRWKAATGREFGNDRPLVRTISGDYGSRDFVFEIDITIPRDTPDLAYVGFGRGEPNPAYYDEPASAFLFRVHNGVGSNAIHVTASRPATTRVTEAGPAVYADFETIGTYEAGTTTRVRIERDGRHVTMSIPATGASHTFDWPALPHLFDEREGFLFFGNSTEGTIFSRAAVRPRG